MAITETIESSYYGGGHRHFDHYQLKRDLEIEIEIEIEIAIEIGLLRITLDVSPTD